MQQQIKHEALRARLSPKSLNHTNLCAKRCYYFGAFWRLPRSLSTNLNTHIWVWVNFPSIVYERVRFLLVVRQGFITKTVRVRGQQQWGHFDADNFWTSNQWPTQGVRGFCLLFYRSTQKMLDCGQSSSKSRIGEERGGEHNDAKSVH